MENVEGVILRAGASNPRKGFEWPAQYFFKLSVPSILEEVEDRFDVKAPFFLFFSNFRDHCDFGTKSGKSGTDFRQGPFFLEITMILVQKVGNLRLISGEDHFFFFLEITMILRQKVANLKLISGEDLFFGDHYDFGAKSGVFCLFGPPIFSMGQNGPRLKKVGHP